MSDNLEDESAMTARAIAAFYGNHTWLMRTMIECAGKLPTLEPGDFRDGFFAGIEEAMACADASAGDGGHQLQDAWSDIAALMSGEAVLLHVPDGVTAEEFADRLTTILPQITAMKGEGE